jgi:hypothetical protein
MIIANDSDLLEPIKIVREALGKMGGILNPRKAKPGAVAAY